MKAGLAEPPPTRSRSQGQDWKQHRSLEAKNSLMRQGLMRTGFEDGCDSLEGQWMYLPEWGQGWRESHGGAAVGVVIM
jgi:hypothetical protein